MQYVNKKHYRYSQGLGIIVVHGHNIHSDKRNFDNFIKTILKGLLAERDGNPMLS